MKIIKILSIFCLLYPFNGVFGQVTDPLLQLINAKLPNKIYFKSDLDRLKFRNLERLLVFVASDFDYTTSEKIAVLFNGNYFGFVNASGVFLTDFEERTWQNWPIDSVKMVVAEYEPTFQTRKADFNFFGKINVQVQPVVQMDTVPPNRFEITKITLDKSLFRTKSGDKSVNFATNSVRGYWFLGNFLLVNSVQLGASLEIPLTQKFCLQSSFAYSFKSGLLGKYVRTPFEEFTYNLTEVAGDIQLKYYLNPRYNRFFLVAGGFVSRATGYLQGGRDYTPAEYLGPKTGFGLRFGAGIQFFSGLFGGLSLASTLTKSEKLLPIQSVQSPVVFVGWMIGQR